MVLNVVFLKETPAFPDVFESAKVRYYCLAEMLYSLLTCIGTNRRSELSTGPDPLMVLFIEHVGDDDIALVLHLANPLFLTSYLIRLSQIDT